MGKKRMAWEKSWLVAAALVLGRVGWGQTLPTEPLPTPLTPWICVRPTVPSYSACKDHPAVVPDVYPFRTGCYDLRTGMPADCQESWILYHSTEGVIPVAMDYWTGAHLHPRESGDHPRASIGEILLDFMAESSARSGEWQTQGKVHWGDVLIPEASGVSRLFVYFVAERGYYCVANDVWVRDPADSTCRACMGTFLIEAHVEGLEPLPDSEWYETASNPYDHKAGKQFYATPEMIRRLTELSKRYVEWYEGETGKKIRVSFNDLSLLWGGIYDYKQERRWDCPHALHRVGRSADVNTRERPWIIKNKIDELAKAPDLNLKEMHTKPGDNKIHLEMQ